ncbi:nucleotide triphosphate diphosphatase NUDT15 isoform X2 [Galendromus occidentalis]|uniref:Nucleotide triphosphate diphosphatase NUDT15 isoform X2 n=1 Tax=Galendromus occidentalis TaxID=34638 RepID=A0AAJ6QUK9_9ACAR|nr:nucleotide triphosphate diphosphatase NUDT15 isoform X2 [Galendromus occidentalis]
MSPKDVKRPGVGCGVFVLSEKHPGKFLIGTRRNSTGPGCLQLPGGHVEFGESWEQTAQREVLEEVGVHLRDISFVDVVNSVRLDVNYHYVTIFMKGFIDFTKPDAQVRNMEPDYCDGWDWVTMEELKEDKRPLFYALRDLVFENKSSPFT